MFYSSLNSLKLQIKQSLALGWLRLGLLCCKELCSPAYQEDLSASQENESLLVFIVLIASTAEAEQTSFPPDLHYAKP